MKKIIILLILLFTLTSCYENIKEVENRDKETTIELQKLPEDTMLVSVNGDMIYAFDMEKQVVYKVQNLYENGVPVGIGFIIAFVVMALLLFLILYDKLTD